MDGIYNTEENTVTRKRPSALGTVMRPRVETVGYKDLKAAAINAGGNSVRDLSIALDPMKPALDSASLRELVRTLRPDGRVNAEDLNSQLSRLILSESNKRLRDLGIMSPSRTEMQQMLRTVYDSIRNRTSR